MVFYIIHIYKINGTLFRVDFLHVGVDFFFGMLLFFHFEDRLIYDSTFVRDQI